MDSKTSRLVAEVVNDLFARKGPCEEVAKLVKDEFNIKRDL